MSDTNAQNQTGIVELRALLSSMSPELIDGEFVFCTTDAIYDNYTHLKPIATFVESEGLTLILSKDVADQGRLAYETVFKQITLTVHSSLDAVGLTAAVAAKLTSYGISTNVVASYYHDHIFVPLAKADQALAALKEFAAGE